MSEDAMTEELKPLPCPFCGGKASAKIGLNSFSDAEVVCDLCGASGGLHDSSGGLECDDALAAENEAEAIKAWNTRSPAWRDDMESAPRDGTRILVVAKTDNGPEVDIVETREDGAFIHEGEPTFCHSYYFEPYLWQLPLPPEEGRG